MAALIALPAICLFAARRTHGNHRRGGPRHPPGEQTSP